jgi:Zn-dependent M16 (insulinase) family peptidase
LRIHVDFYAKGLREENQAIAGLLSESIRAPRFDEFERLAFLIDSSVQDKRNALADDGDDYARYSAAAPLSPLRKFDDRIRGTSSLAFYRDLHDMSQSEKGIKEISRRLAQLHQRIVSSEPTVITAGMEQDGRELARLLELPPSSPQAQQPVVPAKEPAFSNAALHATAQVNHCFAAWPAPGAGHPDAPALAVLGEILTNLVLHQALREEGGAYGGQAGYSTSAGTFVMMSYRDPRLAATYKDFEHAISWVMDAELKQENIEEAIICVIQDLDKPRTPFGDVMWSWDQQQQGVTEEMQRRYRHGVLHCTAQDIKAAAAAWLRDKPYSRAAFVGNTEQDLAGLEVADLMKLAS